MERIEDVIFRNIIRNEEYTRAVSPHLKEEYFEFADKHIFKILHSFILKYNKNPTIEVLEVGLEKSNLNEKEYEEAELILKTIKEGESNSELEWLIQETETFCQDKSLFNAIQTSVEIYDGSSKLEKGQIPKLVEDALSITFNTDIGLRFFGDAEKRFELYHKQEERIPFNIDILNIITRNGVPKKTLNLIMGDTNVGKSLCLCSLAAMYSSMGYNVLYITMEMSEEAVYERIDANLLDVNIEDLIKLSKSDFLSKINNLNKKTNGEVVVKEFPTAGAHCGHFRHLLNELKTKQKFKPDVILIDYLNICQSFRYRTVSVNSYSYVKSVAEEIRGLGVEFDAPIWSATQSGRGGNNNADLQLTDISESYGVAQTVDLLLAVMPMPEMQDVYLFSQLKSRYTKKNIYPRFILGVDYGKMRLYEVDKNDQKMLYENRSTTEEQKNIINKSNNKLNTTNWVFN